MTALKVVVSWLSNIYFRNRTIDQLQNCCGYCFFSLFFFFFWRPVHIWKQECQIPWSVTTGCQTMTLSSVMTGTSDYDPVICDDGHVRLWLCHLGWQACWNMTLSSVTTGMSDYNPIICDNRYVRLRPYHLWQQACQTMICDDRKVRLWAHHLWQNITHLQHKEAAPAKRFMRTNVFTCIHIYEIYTREGN